MKIGFCLKENKFNSELDKRFGRCEWFGIADSETGNELGVFENPAKNEPSGAGSSAVQLLVNKGVDVIVAPEFGPKAFNALNRFSVKLFKQGENKTVSQALEAWKIGSLESPEAPGHGGLHKA